jgi:hypothetical protein
MNCTRTTSAEAQVCGSIMGLGVEPHNGKMRNFTLDMGRIFSLQCPSRLAVLKLISSDDCEKNMALHWLFMLILFQGKTEVYPEKLKKINLESLGFTGEDYSACFHRGKLYLASEDHLLVNLDATGKIIAKYAKSGEGPKEIMYPVIYGVNKDKLVVQNRRSTFMFFDENLQPVGELLQGPEQLGRGMVLPSGDIIARRAVLLGNHLGLYKVNGTRLKMVESFGAGKGSYVEDKFAATGGFFGLKSYFMGNYRLDHVSDYELFEMGYEKKDNETIQALQGSLHDKPKKECNILVEHAYRLKQGYVVAIVFYTKGPNFICTYIDHYDLKGAFKKREVIKKYANLALVHGTEAALLIDTENLTATYIEN